MLSLYSFILLKAQEPAKTLTMQVNIYPVKSHLREVQTGKDLANSFIACMEPVKNIPCNWKGYRFFVSAEGEVSKIRSYKEINSYGGYYNPRDTKVDPVFQEKLKECVAATFRENKSKLSAAELNQDFIISVFNH